MRNDEGALVPGGSRGVGRGIAHALVREGWRSTSPGAGLQMRTCPQRSFVSHVTTRMMLKLHRHSGGSRRSRDGLMSSSTTPGAATKTWSRQVLVAAKLALDMDLRILTDVNRGR